MAETFDQFCNGPEGVMAITFPEGAAEECQARHRMDIRAALMDIIDTVEYYKRKCRDTFPFCSTLFSCGATVIEAPRGEIQRVFTLESMCCPVRYDWMPDYDVFLNWLNANRRRYTDPANAGMPNLPRPFKFSEASLDKGYRNNWGKWTLHNGRIYLGDRIESTETAIVEYMGKKRDWKPDDIMPYDEPESDQKDMGVELKLTVSSFLRKEHLRIFERDEKGSALEEANYARLIAALKYTDWKERIPKAQPERKFDQLLVTGEETCRSAECAAVSSSDTGVSGVFAIIGDWGDPANGTAAADVQELVRGWTPDFIITTGDNRYNVTFEDLFAELTYYGGFVDRGMMFAGIGNHDTDDGGGIEEFLETFEYLPGDKRNYDIQLGNVHFFFRETHDTGTFPVSAAALALSSARLRVRLASSRAKWKVVITQDPPNVSQASNGNGHAASQLDYEAWGADVVISGDSHFYERLAVDGYPTIVNGIGGTIIDQPDGPIAGSVFRYAASNGAIKGRATCDTLQLEFYNIAGELLDTLVFGPTIVEAEETIVNEGDTNTTLVQNVTNIVNNITGIQHYLGAFTDPNGNVVGNVGDIYSSLASLGGDGQMWRKATGTGTNTGWE